MRLKLGSHEHRPETWPVLLTSGVANLVVAVAQHGVTASHSYKSKCFLYVDRADPFDIRIHLSLLPRTSSKHPNCHLVRRLRLAKMTHHHQRRPVPCCCNEKTFCPRHPPKLNVQHFPCIAPKDVSPPKQHHKKPDPRIVTKYTLPLNAAQAYSRLRSTAPHKIAEDYDKKQRSPPQAHHPRRAVYIVEYHWAKYKWGIAVPRPTFHWALLVCHTDRSERGELAGTLYDWGSKSGNTPPSDMRGYTKRPIAWSKSNGEREDEERKTLGYFFARRTYRHVGYTYWKPNLTWRAGMLSSLPCNPFTFGRVLTAFS